MFQHARLIQFIMPNLVIQSLIENKIGHQFANALYEFLFFPRFFEIAHNTSGIDRFDGVAMRGLPCEQYLACFEESSIRVQRSQKLDTSHSRHHVV